MKKESLRFATIAFCISAVCGSAYSANNSASNSSSGNSANAATSSATAERADNDSSRNTAGSQNSSGNRQDNKQDRDAVKNLPAADKNVPLNLSRASKVIDTNVEDADGNKIGDIKDVVLDRKSGQVAYAVVDFGGWLGMGDKYFAVPWKSLKNGNNDHYVLNVGKDALKKAPGFDKDHWPDMASENWNRENAQAYNQKPYWEQSTASGHHHVHGRSSGSSKGADSSRSGGPSHKSSIEKEPVSKSK